MHRVGSLWYNWAINNMACDGISIRDADLMGEIYPKLSCTLDVWVEHIVHINGARKVSAHDLSDQASTVRQSRTDKPKGFAALPSARSAGCSEAEAY